MFTLWFSQLHSRAPSAPVPWSERIHKKKYISYIGFKADTELKKRTTVAGSARTALQDPPAVRTPTPPPSPSAPALCRRSQRTFAASCTSPQTGKAGLGLRVRPDLQGLHC